MGCPIRPSVGGYIRFDARQCTDGNRTKYELHQRHNVYVDGRRKSIAGRGRIWQRCRFGRAARFDRVLFAFGCPIALTLGPSFSPVFAEYTASGTLNFEITSMPGGLGTDLLSGTLKLVDLIQGATTGMTNTSGVADMTITGGSLKGDYPGLTGISQLNINLKGLGFLPTFSGSQSTKLNGATLNALPTPEPWSMLLYGSGLVLIGFVLRRRLAPVGLAARA